MIARALELFISGSFNIIAIILIVKIAIKIFFSFGNNKKDIEYTKNTTIKVIRADWETDKEEQVKNKEIKDNEEDIFMDYFDNVKRNAKSQLLSIVFLILFVFIWLATKNISC